MFFQFLLAVIILKKYNNFRLIFCLCVLSLSGLRGQAARKTGSLQLQRGIVQR